MSNPHEDRAREEKARKLARAIIGETIGVLLVADENVWFDIAVRLGVPNPSEKTRLRVIEILEGIAI